MLAQLELIGSMSAFWFAFILQEEQLLLNELFYGLPNTTTTHLIATYARSIAFQIFTGTQANEWR